MKYAHNIHQDLYSSSIENIIMCFFFIGTIISIAFFNFAGVSVTKVVNRPYLFYLLFCKG